MMRTILKCARLWMMVAMLWLGSIAHGSPGVIEDQTLYYALSYGGRNAGEVEITIRNENHGYTITSAARPSALASLFVKALFSDTRFVQRPDGMTLDRGTERFAGRSDQRSFRVDHERRRIEFSNGKQHAIQPGDQFEAAAFPLLLMLRPLESLAGTRVWGVSAKRTRGYTYEQPVEEMVKVPAGEFASWKINRYRTDRPADSVTVWLRKADDLMPTAPPIPVKIAVNKKGTISTFKLTGTDARL